MQRFSLLDFIILFLNVLYFPMCMCFFGYRKVETYNYVDGYVPHSSKGCPGNDFLGSINVKDENECCQICDKYAQCVAVTYQRNYRTNVCFPKSVCERLEYVGGSYNTYIKMSTRKGCTFDPVPGYALYGNNNKVIHIDLDGCKKECLADSQCLSFDFNNRTKYCFLSKDNRETQPAYFGVHHGMVYYQRRCGTDISDVPITVINAQSGGVLWMKDSQCIKSYGHFGSYWNGNEFSDEARMFTNITEIGLMYGRYVERIGFKYGTWPRETHGNYGSIQFLTTLNPGEYIKEVQGWSGSKIDSLTIITNKRTFGPFGSRGGRSFSVESGGKPLLYISGTISYSLKSLSFHFMC